MARKKVAPKEEKKAALQVRYTLDGGKPYDLDLGGLTLAERVEVEEYLGMPWVQANANGWIFSEKAHAYFALIAMRRRRVKITLQEILDSNELDAEFNPAEDSEGKDGGGTPDSSGSQS